MLPRSVISVAMLVAFALVTGCTETPHETLGDKVIDGVRNSDDDPVMPRFSEATTVFEKAVEAFNTSPINTAAPLELAEDRIRELRRAFDR